MPELRQYCNRCAGLIDETSHKCTRCGKRAFHMPSKRSFSFIVCLVIALTVGVTIFVYTIHEESPQAETEQTEAQETDQIKRKLYAAYITKTIKEMRSLSVADYDGTENSVDIQFCIDQVELILEHYDDYKEQTDSYGNINLDPAANELKEMLEYLREALKGGPTLSENASYQDQANRARHLANTLRVKGCYDRALLVYQTLENCDPLAEAFVIEQDSLFHAKDCFHLYNLKRLKKSIGWSVANGRSACPDCIGKNE